MPDKINNCTYISNFEPPLTKVRGFRVLIPETSCLPWVRG